MSATTLWGRHRQTVAMVLLAVVVALACVALGRWQLHRYQDKHARKQLVQRNYDAPAVALGSLLTRTGGSFDPTLQWRPVRATGTYDVAGTTLVRNRPRDIGGNPVFGYEVLVPLVLDDGSALLVDRGWVPSGTTGRNPGEQPDSVPAPPSGRVEVLARLRPSEPRRPGRTAPGQVGSIALGQVAPLVGHPLYPAFGQLVRETPAAPTAPQPLGRPELDGGEGINLSYAFQWWLFALLALGFPFWWARRRRQAVEIQPLPGEAPVPAAAVRRRRIWDDEDE